MTRWRSALPWVLTCTMLVGCTLDGSREPHGDSDSPTTSTPSTPPREAFTAPSVQGLPATAVDLPLQLADDQYARLSSWTDVGTVYMTMANPDAPADKTDEGTTIVRVADHKTVATYRRSAPNRQLYRMFFWRDTAIVQETTDIEAGAEGGRIHLSRYDLTTGEDTALAPTDGRKLGYLGAAALSGDQFAVAIEKDGQESRCLHVFDLATGVESDISCLPPGPNGIFSVHGANPGFTYLATAGETFDTCRTAYWTRVSGESQVIGGDPSCHTFDHTRYGDWDIWSDIPEAADRANNHTVAVLYARRAAHTMTLGVADPNSVTACGNHVYWRSPGRPGFSQIVRWQPGTPAVEVVHQANIDPDSDGWSLTFPACSQNVVAITRYRPGPSPPPAREVRYLRDA